MKQVIGFLLVISCLPGCGTIYSPTLNLPHEPLSKNQGELTGSLSGLPQNGSMGSLGFTASGEGEVSYGFSDRLSIQLKAWSQLSELYQLQFNGGTSISGTYRIGSADDHIPLAIIATSSSLIEGSSIKADGGSLHLAAWLPELGIFRPYIAAGAGMMVVNFKSNDWGYGGIINAGTSMRLSENFTGNIEIFGILQRYIYYRAITGYLAPSFSLSWHFNNK